MRYRDRKKIEREKNYIDGEKKRMRQIERERERRMRQAEREREREQ